MTRDISGKLTHKLIIYLFAFSLLFTIVYTAIEFKQEYDSKVANLNESFLHVQNTILPQVSFSLWQLDDVLLDIQLKNILKLPGVVYVEVEENAKVLFNLGEKQTQSFHEQVYELRHGVYMADELGRLRIQVSYKSVNTELRNGLFDIIIKESLRFFLLAFLLLFLVHKLIIRHLLHMANYTRKLDVETLSTPLLLEKAKVKDELELLNESLEQKVYERTQELERANQELQTALNTLKNTQKQLIQSEKMASLATLVAGVAHEINTPLGIGLTGITHFVEFSRHIQRLYKEEKLDEASFKDYLNQAIELGTIITNNLERSAQLVKSFKQVAVDQSSEVKRVFILDDYMQEIFASIKNITKKTNIELSLSCPKNLKVDSYPGAFAQIITNLIINSIKHGFSKGEKGNIDIALQETKEGIELLYKDNGKGISEENLPKIFDPFFTTNREDGGSGLGLNIVYNLITTTFDGSITCHSEVGKGVSFTIVMKM